MNNCSDGHEEIVYTCQGCPLCSAMTQILKYEKEIESLQDDLKDVLRSMEP